jgi:hypothetical protein
MAVTIHPTQSSKDPSVPPPHERFRHTDEVDDPNLPGQMQTTISIRLVSCGTELDIMAEGIPDVIPPKGYCLGWQASLTRWRSWWRPRSRAEGPSSAFLATGRRPRPRPRPLPLR